MGRYIQSGPTFEFEGDTYQPTVCGQCGSDEFKAAYAKDSMITVLKCIDCEAGWEVVHAG